MLATAEARSRTGSDVAIFHDTVWVYRKGETCLAISERFGRPGDWDWIDRLMANKADYFLHRYPLRPGDVVLDIGAGYGQEALLFARRVGSRGRVVAVEANPRACEGLRTTCRLNGLAQVEPVNVAIADAEGRLFIEDAENHLANRLVARPAAGSRVESMATTTIDQLCRDRGIETIDFLKMNIEGAERSAMRGFTEMVRRTRHVCISCHDFLAGGDPTLRTREEVTGFLQANGFDIVTRADDPRDYMRDYVYGENMAPREVTTC
jgi:FkbM family methyltransferase